MEVVNNMKRCLVTLITSLMFFSCAQEPKNDPRDLYPNKENIAQIVIAKNSTTGDIEHRAILYNDSSVLLISYDKLGHQTDSSYTDSSGMRQGLSKKFLEDGSYEYVQYLNGKMNGPYRKYNSNGGLIEQGEMKDNLAEGVWMSYYDSGNLKNFEFFSLYGKIFQRAYAENGDLLGDGGSPFVLYNVNISRDKFSAQIKVARPPNTILKMFKVNPVDTSFTDEIIFMGTNFNFVEDRQLGDSIIFFGWKLLDKGTDTIQSQGIGAHQSD